MERAQVVLAHEPGDTMPAAGFAGFPQGQKHHAEPHQSRGWP
jgi:hypothetical protein